MSKFLKETVKYYRKYLQKQFPEIYTDAEFFRFAIECIRKVVKEHRLDLYDELVDYCDRHNL